MKIILVALVLLCVGCGPIGNAVITDKQHNSNKYLMFIRCDGWDKDISVYKEVSADHYFKYDVGDRLRVDEPIRRLVKQGDK